MNLSKATGRVHGTGEIVVIIEVDDDYRVEKKFSTNIQGKTITTNRDIKMAVQYVADVLNEYQPGLGSMAPYYATQGFRRENFMIIMKRNYR